MIIPGHRNHAGISNIDADQVTLQTREKRPVSIRPPMHQSFAGSASWKELLGSPPRASHVVQIYDAHDFLASAVAHFAAEGLQRGEAVLLYGTREHLGAIRGQLCRSGIAVEAAVRNGQLALGDVHEALVTVAPGGSVDPALFDKLAGAMLDSACGDSRFSGVRWWGEMCNTLYHRGDREGALLAEKCSDALNRKYGAALFCSFLCDRFDAAGYDGCLKDMCCTHSHVIPAEDYVRHRLAVNRAVAEVVGDIQGTLLQSLSSWQGPQCHLPSSQALLFWLRETLPEHFDTVLARARAYQTHQSGAHRRVHVH